MRKESVSVAVRTGITITLLIYVAFKAGLFTGSGREALMELIASARGSFVVFSIMMSPLLNFSSSLKWYMLLISRGIRVELWRLFLYYIVAKFYNLALPTSMGGDVVRIFSLGSHTGRQAEALASVFVERFSGMVTLIFITMITLLVNLKTFNMPIITISLIVCTLIVIIVVWLVFDDRPYNAFRKFSDNRWRFLDQLLAKIDKVHEAVGKYKNDPCALWIAIINSLIFYFLAVINVWVSSLAFNSETNFYTILIGVPVILIIMNLPVSIGGIGLMEFAYIFTFELIGYSPALGLSTALLMRFKTFIDAGAGGLIHLLLLKDRPVSTKVKEVTK